MVIVLICMAAGPSIAAAQSAEQFGSLEGIVLDRDTRRPAAAIVLVDGTPLTAATSPDGRFSLPGVPAGMRTIHVEAPGYLPLVSSDVSISPGRVSTLTVELVMAPRDFTEQVTVVGASSARPPGVLNTSYGVTSEETRRSAGSLGGDLNRVIQALPGLSVVGDGRNDLIVRGGSPSENLTLVDGIEVPNLNHFGSENTTGGAYSMLNNQLLADVTFLGGGFPAQYGNRLSSVLDVRLRDGNRTRTELKGDINFIGAALVGEGPLGPHGSWIGSVRRSFIDLVASAANLGPSVPRLTSYNLKGAYDLGPRDKVWVLGIGGKEDFARPVDATDVSEPSLQSTDIRSARTTTGAAWQRLFGRRAYGVLTVSDSISHQYTELHDRQLQDELVFLDDSTNGETTVRYDLASHIAPAWNVRAGGNWKRLRGTLHVEQPLGVQSPYSTDPARIERRYVDLQPVAGLAGGFVEVSGNITDRLAATMGGRVDHFTLMHATTASPHAGLEVALSPRLKIELSTGRYHQQPELLALVAAPENLRLSPIEADHLVLGAAYEPRSDLHLSVETYVKRYRHEPVSLEHPTFSLANSGADFIWSDGLLFPLVDAGLGLSRGVELFAKKTLTDRIYGQIAYSFSRAEQAALDGVFRRGSYDTPQIMTLQGGSRLRRRWELSGRFSFSSGRPYTPALMAESLKQNRWIYDLSRVNGERLPNYNRLDLRVDRPFALKGAHLAFFAEVHNVANTRSATAYVWNTKIDAPQALPPLGRLSILGLTVEF